MNAEQGGIWLPIGRALSVPMQRLGRRVGTAMAMKRGLADLSQVYDGRSARPKGEIMLVGPDGQTPIIIAGMGECEVAEIEEIGLAAMEKAEKQVAATGSAIDFDAVRERHGLPRREEFDQHFRQALVDRAERHRKNPIADPERTLESHRPRGQSMQAVTTNPLKEPASAD